MRDKAILELMANMPSIMTMMTELNTLLNNMPKEPIADLTVTLGKSTLKLNSKKDADLYDKFFQTFNDTSVSKIWKLRDSIDSLLYPPSEVDGLEKV